MNKISYIHKILNFTIAIIFLSQSVAYPLPTNPDVQEGSADITIDGSTMNITATDNTIINFDSFNIAEGESVIINLPTINSDILSRVVGNQVSMLAGNLNVNGIFILVNTNGIYVASTAQIEAAGLVLSTLNITDQNFLDSSYLFEKLSEDQLNMLLVNEGNITINEGGFAAFIAGAIENNGTIVAPLGTIALATGEAIRLDISGNDLISVAIERALASQILDSSGNPITDQIKNTGNIEANGGVVILDAEALPGIFTKAINMEGFIIADEFNDQDGKIILSSTGDIYSTGTLQAIGGSIDVDTDTITSHGVLKTELLTGSANNWKMGGTIAIGIGNTLGFYEFDTNTSWSGILNDNGDITITSGKTVTLTGHSEFNADADASGPGGVFTMESGATITTDGTYWNLGIKSSATNESGTPANSELGAIIANVGILTLDKSATTPIYTMNDGINVREIIIEGGILNQGASNGINTTAGGVTVAEEACWINNGSGAIALGGDVINDGLIMLNGGGGGIGADVILISTTFSGDAEWSGTGTFIITDVDVTNQAEAVNGLITVYSSTNSGNLGGDAWLYNSNENVQGILWDNDSGDGLWSNALNWSENQALTSQDIPVFTGMGNTDSTVDASLDTGFGGAVVGGLIIGPGYTGTITLAQDFNLDAGSGQEIPGDFWQNSAGSTFDCATYRFYMGFASPASGYFTLSAGTFKAPFDPDPLDFDYNYLDIGNDFDLTGGTFIHNNGTVVFYGANDLIMTADEGEGETTFYNVIFDIRMDGLTGSINLNDDFTVANNLSMTNAANNCNLTVKGVNGVYPTITVRGDLDLQYEEGTVTPNPAMNFGSSIAANNITIDLEGDLEILDPLINFYANINFTNLSADQAINQTAGVINYGTWTINKGSSIATMGSDLVMKANSILIIQSGVLDVKTYDIDLRGAAAANFNNTGTLNINGSRTSFTNFTNDVDSGTVEYYGSGSDNSLTAGNAYYNLKITGAGGIYKFNAGQTYTVNGDLTIQGSPGNLVTLKSTVIDSQWNIDVNAVKTRNVSYVDVKDSNSLTLPVINATNSVNSEGNTSWTFDDAGEGIPDPEPPPLPEPPDPPPIIPTPEPEPGPGVEPDPIIKEPDDMGSVINTGGAFDLGSTYEDGGANYDRKYRKGKYKVVVIVFEGRVVEAPYDKDGPKYDQGVVLEPGQKNSRMIEI